LDHAGAGIQGGETYAVPVNISEDDAYRFWIQAPRAIFVAQDDDGYYLGTYFIKTNHPGPGNHVCNCGYIVSESARGRGLAGELCRHSLDVARERGYRAMQYNLVVAKTPLPSGPGKSTASILPGPSPAPSTTRVTAMWMPM